MNTQTFPQQPSLAAATAQRLARYMRTDFNPTSDASWRTADLLWRAALISRDAERMAAEVLVLAAPDLLEALRELLKHAGIADAAAEDIDGEDHARESRARAAIAAVEGKQS